MKKNQSNYFFILGALLNIILSWGYSEEEFSKRCYFSQGCFELRGSAYYLTNHRTRQAYSIGGSAGFELDGRLYTNLYGWGGGSFVYLNNQSMEGNYSSQIYLAPLTLGLKWIFGKMERQSNQVSANRELNKEDHSPMENFCAAIERHSTTVYNTIERCQWKMSFRPYLGIGALGSYVNVQTNIPFLISSQSKWTFGGVIKSGFLFAVTPLILLDFFVDYAIFSVKMNTSRHHTVQTNPVDLSGLFLGAALGFSW